MHAGTSLGDPIEMGAAAAVYGRRPSGASLTLFTSKTWLGHAEPAAGTPPAHPMVYLCLVR